jgi:hypothetical protein
LVGGHTIPIVIDENYRAHRQSIRPPGLPPSVAVGAGPYSQVCYLRFYDEVTQERSPLSEGKVLPASDLNRVWTGIPTAVDSEAVQIDGTANFGPPGAAANEIAFTNRASSELRPGDRIAIVGSLTQWGKVLTFPNLANVTIDDLTMMGPQNVSVVVKPVSRISHVELWVSVDGSLPRFIRRVRIGTTAVTESTPVLSLGEAEINAFTSIPLGTINLMYNKRQLVAGVEGRQDTVFISELEFPERFTNLAFITHYNEPIVGLLRYRDYVIVLCPDSSYRLQGYTADDYTLTVLDARVGGLGHHGNAVSEVQAFIPGKKGIQIFNGAFHQGLSNRRTEWMKNYKSHTIAYERAIGYVNDNDETYQFLPYAMRWGSHLNQETSEQPGTNLEFPFSRFNVKKANPIVLVGTYSDVGPQSGGAIIEPEWVDDTVTSPVSGTDNGNNHGVVTYAKYIAKTGEKIGRLYRGDSWGRVYMECLLDDEQSPALHDDSYIVPGHLAFGEPGGDKEGEGHKYIRGWSYLVSEWSDWVLTVFPGDDYARCPRPLPEFTDRSTEDPWVAIAADDVYISNPFIPAPPNTPTSQFTKIASRLILSFAGRPYRAQPESVHPHSSLDCESRGFTFEYKLTKPRCVRFIGFGLVVGPGTITRPTWIQGV